MFINGTKMCPFSVHYRTLLLTFVKPKSRASARVSSCSRIKINGAYNLTNMASNFQKMNQGRILIIEDNADILLSAELLLKKYFKTVTTYDDPANAFAHLRFNAYDVVLLDMNFSRGENSGGEGLHWLKRIKQQRPETVVVMITAFGDVDLAVKTIRAGAMDFVLKPWQNEKLIATVMAAFELSRNKQKVSELEEKQKAMVKAEDGELSELLGNNQSMRKLAEKIKKVAQTDANILLLGENGTGKEVAARQIHVSSPRHNNVFVKVDLGSIPESLFESELFGFVKGAFTDAKEDRPGRFEIASGGTLFLDEIGNLSLTMQTKLLSVLQNRQVVRLGSNQVRDIDVRLVCATNMPLNEMVANGQFRRDLLYRINTVELQILPLRERPDDIPVIASYYLEMYSKKYLRQGMKFSNATLTALKKYSWPGNVRELQHAIERAVILTEGNEPEIAYLVPDTYKEMDMNTDSLNLDEIEKSAVIKALSMYNRNISRAAKELGLTRAALYRRIEKYEL